MSHAAAALTVDQGQRDLLEQIARSRSAEHRMVQRALALLYAADGVSNSDVAGLVGVSRPTVLAWRCEFAERGVAGLGKVAPGRGRKASIPQATIDRIVELTLRERRRVPRTGRAGRWPPRSG